MINAAQQQPLPRIIPVPTAYAEISARWMLTAPRSWALYIIAQEDLAFAVWLTQTAQPPILARLTRILAFPLVPMTDNALPCNIVRAPIAYSLAVQTTVNA